MTSHVWSCPLWFCYHVSRERIMHIIMYVYIYIVYISSDVSNTLHVPSTRKNMYFISCDLLAGGFNPSPASMLVTPTRSSSGIYRDIPKTSPWNKLILDTWIPTISGMYPFMYTYIYIYTRISLSSSRGIYSKEYEFLWLNHVI